MHISTILKHYKREDIRKEIVENAIDKEIAVKYSDKGFGKRPDVIRYPNDVLEFVKQGATSFHASEELWSNPLNINTELRKSEIDELRVGWDLVLDIDCVYWEFAKITAHLMIKALNEYGIKSISCKFSGNKGFHIGVPFQSFDIEGMKVNELFPEAPRSIASYLLEVISEKYIRVTDNTILFDNRYKYSIEDLKRITGKDIEELTNKRCRRCKNEVKESKVEIYEYLCRRCGHTEKLDKEEENRLCLKCKFPMDNENKRSPKYLCSCGSTDKPEDKFNPLSIVDVDTILISSRHLYRMPYSLHEKSELASVPINPYEIMKFEKALAKPPVEISQFRFIDRSGVIRGEGKRLLDAAFNFSEQEHEENEQENKKEFLVPEEAIPEQFFPPCIKKILAGLKDGKKRALFVLVNFLSCAGYSADSIEGIVKDWNNKNEEKLRENYIVGHLRYHKARNKKVLPPNCSNQMYYKSLGICCPDSLCQKIKNPINYSLRKTRFKDGK